MTAPRPPSGRSLESRLALLYAAGAFVAGIAALAVVAVPLAGLESTVPVGGQAPGPIGPAPGTITGTGSGIGPHQLLTGFAVAVAVLVPVALAVGRLVAARFLRPLRAITVTARSISAGDLHRRLDLGEPTDELTELGHILDDLFGRLETAFDAQRHFVANASHELRTPLAGLRTLLEVALADPDADAGSLRSACEEALALGGHQERLVEALLALATGESGITRRENVDLADVAAGVLARRRDRVTRRGLELAEDLAPAVTSGDPGLVESLVANLVDNAVRHNHRGGHVEIATGTAGTEATLTVTNSGPAVPGDQVERLFRPFERLVPERHGHGHGHGDGDGDGPGAGIGLAVVAAVARAHRATVTAGARPEGGLTVTVRFAAPAARGAAGRAADADPVRNREASPRRRP